MGEMETQSGRYWDRVAVAKEAEARYWLGVLAVREWVNRRMTGEPHKLFIQRFLEERSSRWPLPLAASIGCGAGDLERGVVGLGAVERMRASDIGEGSIRLAKDAAARENLADRIEYSVEDAVGFLEHAIERGDRFDLIFFHGVLHHLVDLERVVDLTGRALAADPPGLVYIDEYVGPSRDRWTPEILGYAAGIFERVPERFRRTPHVYPPIAMEDPTEMIRSGEIESVVRERLDVVEWVPYYGNVLNPLACSIRSNALEEPEIVAILQEAMKLEDFLIERGLLEPLYAVCVARRR